MDYSKNTKAKTPTGNPRFDAQNLHRTGKAKQDQSDDKTALLARMKAAYAAKKLG